MIDFHGPNAGYVLELYERYRQSPESVDEKTRAFFANWTPAYLENGSRVFNGTPSPEAVSTAVDFSKAVGVVNYAQAIRQFGHLDAQLDPLGSPPPGDPELSPEYHSITEADLRELPASLVGGPCAEDAATAWEAVQRLRGVYSTSIGYDNDHIRIPEERMWLREAAESGRYRFEGTPQEARALLERLSQVEAFEHFLQKTFPTKYRFSVEGLDMMVPVLDEIVRQSGDTGMTTIAIAMAHRGRLNVLTHVMGKPYQQILSEFRDSLLEDNVGITQGDVKYHMAWKQVIGTNKSGDELVVTMPPNPSHLEAVNPVAVGMARAAGTRTDRPGEPYFDADKTLQILIHGDAAFPGQGIVSETFNLSLLPGYWVGGTIHVIANNQLGFTTGPRDGRSTLYASDLAKGFKVPVIHVNTDDPAACIEVARIAFAYQDTFEKDILIDLVGYRRYGHNELDEPSFTQPLLYHLIRNHKTVRELWSAQLVNTGVLNAEEAAALREKYMEQLQQFYDTLPPAEDMYDGPAYTPPPGAAKAINTAYDRDTLFAINHGLGQIPETFTFYSKRFENTIRSRRNAFEKPGEKMVDWATAEELAFATILADGIPIRLTGQDSERGTFSHRHAVLTDAETGEQFVPLHSFPQARAAFEVHNSPLSESAALGFEYGYNVQAPNRLVLWEAQYGDFNNNAQVIIDEFIVSAREKWGQTPSLVMLLPHGHEGAGPDHSSARPERYLQMAAKLNLRLANPTTAAQYFHLLRRQALLLETDPLPLVVMSPKSLLRNPMVASTVDELTNGRWQPVIDDPEADAEQVERLLLCSGKLYYDLITTADPATVTEDDKQGQTFRATHPQVAIARVEQLYPFPADALLSVIERYPNLQEIVWVQEEPKNMGAWEFMGWRIEKLIEGRLPVNYAGRRRSSSPAEGSKTAHSINQAMVVDAAFNHQFD